MKIFLNNMLVLDNDGIHEANTRLCITKKLDTGAHRVYVVGFAAYLDSELEVTYSGPDTYGVRTVIGGQPFFYACDPRAPMSAAAAFTLCTFKSDPTSSWNGDCTPTVGIAHPRYPGPCAKAIGTDSLNFDVYSGGFYTPVLGSADDPLVEDLFSIVSTEFLQWYLFLQSDVHFVGQALLNTTILGTPDQQGVLKTLVAGTPDCRAEPIGDGLVGVDGQNCPFQMYSVSGAFKISQSGPYLFCADSAAGWAFEVNH